MADIAARIIDQPCTFLLSDSLGPAEPAQDEPGENGNTF
jgi:hypothetical protein